MNLDRPSGKGLLPSLVEEKKKTAASQRFGGAMREVASGKSLYPVLSSSKLRLGTGLGLLFQPALDKSILIQTQIMSQFVQVSLMDLLPK